jgi:hypothetical protein
MADLHRLSEKWLPVSIAPTNTDLEVCVIDNNDIHALIFPVRKDGRKWADARTQSLIDIEPTHWRKWRHGADT